MKPMINRKLLPDPDTLGTTLLSPPITYSPDPLFNASTKSPHSTTTSFRPNSPLDSSVAITALVLLTALFFMGFFSLYLRLFADDYSPSSSSSSSSSSLPLWRRSSNYPKGLDPCTVRSLPLVSYGGAAKHPIDCVICLCEFEEGETVKMIPHCRHVFHPECIDTWLGSHVSCPLCRSSRIFGGGGEMCLGVTRVEVDHSGGESLGRSMVEIEEEGGMEVGPAGRVRRACSCPSLGEVDDDDGSGSLERSTVEIEEGGMEVGPAGMVRRASSYPSMGDRVVLKRSLSF